MPVTHTTHLVSVPNMRDALVLIDQLYADYLKANRKKATIDLTVATIGHAFDRSKRRLSTVPEPVEVRAKWSSEQAGELEWFKEAIK